MEVESCALYYQVTLVMIIVLYKWKKWKVYKASCIRCQNKNYGDYMNSYINK